MLVGVDNIFVEKVLALNDYLEHGGLNFSFFIRPIVAFAFSIPHHYVV